MRIRTITTLLTAAVLVYSSFPRNAAAADSPVSAAPSQQDIRAFYAAHPFSHAAPVYAEPPQTEAPYSAGSLSAETLEEACAVHGVEPDEVAEAINAKISETNN